MTQTTATAATKSWNLQMKTPNKDKQTTTTTASSHRPATAATNSRNFRTVGHPKIPASKNGFNTSFSKENSEHHAQPVGTRLDAAHLRNRTLLDTTHNQLAFFQKKSLYISNTRPFSQAKRREYGMRV
jgi:hypothetical protein